MHAVPRGQVPACTKKASAAASLSQGTHAVFGTAEHQRGAVQAVGKLECLGGIIQQVLGVRRVKNVAGLAIPDALHAGHRETPAVFKIAAEQQRTRQIFIRCFGENAGGGQLQPGEARLLHGRVYGFVIVLLPCNVRDGKLIARHGSALQLRIKARNIINSCCFCAKVVPAAAQNRPHGGCADRNQTAAWQARCASPLCR